ncbi:MAG: hypothetical protein IPL35_01400 [Sphingobacteriales bacterium]|nr:hypothetical protein [Sphingobacteriales bacterium]
MSVHYFFGKKNTACFIFLSCCFIIAASTLSCENKSTSAATYSGNLLEARKQHVAEVLASETPIITLDKSVIGAEAYQAQTIALGSSEFKKNLFDSKHTPYKNEIFQVRPLAASDRVSANVNCGDGTCYKVEMYNYALNITTLAIIDLKKERVLRTIEYPDMQPELPEHLVKLAVYIANESPEVQAAVGGKPNEDKAIMERTKTALNNSRCERSQHLCVAPTYVLEPKALWAIVDLTDENMVGTRWTEVGNTGLRITERRLQNDFITEEYCEKEHTLERDGWTLKYMMTSSDGLMIYDAAYKGASVINSLKLVDWHVNYSRTEGFGYSDAVGCPYFSSAAVVAVEAPNIQPLVQKGDTVGFVIVQSYWSEGWPAPCNYNYQQKFEFYKDGSFRPAAASIGRGCGTDGIYRPVLRIALNGAQQEFSEFESENKWKKWQKEQWKLQDAATPLSEQGFQYQVQQKGKWQYAIEPGRGQFDDGGRGDQAFLYVTKDNPQKEEGTMDLPTIGPCCNTDYRQGPEKFINNESVEQQPLVIWYVPEMHNDNAPDESIAGQSACLKTEFCK